MGWVLRVGAQALLLRGSAGQRAVARQRCCARDCAAAATLAGAARPPPNLACRVAVAARAAIDLRADKLIVLTTPESQPLDLPLWLPLSDAEALLRGMAPAGAEQLEDDLQRGECGAAGARGGAALHSSQVLSAQLEGALQRRERSAAGLRCGAWLRAGASHAGLREVWSSGESEDKNSNSSFHA